MKTETKEMMKEFFQTPVWRILSASFNVILIFILVIWTFEVLELQSMVMDINIHQLEECYYLKCDKDGSGRYVCKQEHFESGKQFSIGEKITDEELEWIKNINTHIRNKTEVEK